ncbi:MAG: hypothetical protein GX629_03975 [Phycisphaerae bacterium]|nr:hypothetical protein [Phycisphaerae bacterium]
MKFTIWLITFEMITVVCLFWQESFSDAAESQPGVSIFSQTKTPGTEVNWRGNVLIEKVTLTYLEPKTFTQTGEVQTTRVGGWEVVNTISKNPELPYRKEVGIRSDRVEITVQCNLPAYRNVASKGYHTYMFYVPIESLMGMRWTAIIGPSGEPKTVKGVLTEQTPDGELAGSAARWIGFSSMGKNIIFDLNPKGLTSSYCSNSDLHSPWNVRKAGKYITFSISVAARDWGGVLSSKVIIFEASPDDYLNYHTGDPYWYFYQIPIIQNFIFGEYIDDKAYVTIKSNLYDVNKGYGWASNEGLKDYSEVPASFVYTATMGSRDNEFIIKVDKPGLYVVRIFSSNITADESGPFSVISNGEMKARDQKVQGGKYKTITYLQWLPAGEFRLRLTGSWILSGLSLQRVIHENEDYAFNRGVWLVPDIFEPTPVLSSRFYRKPPEYKVAISEIDLPPKKLIEPKSIEGFSDLETSLPAVDDPKMAWRYDGFIGGMGQDNNGTFLEYDTPEKITRRLKEMKAKGVTVVILNGYLARHCFQGQLARVQKKVKEITQIAHSLDIKVIDHCELTILWYMETALRYMSEHLDWCQRTIDDDTLFQGLCPLNRAHRNAYFSRMREYIADTGIDGVMIDEVGFHSGKTCGCDYCRAQFTKETGLIMPIGKNSQMIDTKSSLLHKAWFEWRQKAVGDWWVEFRKKAADNRKDFCIMGYVCNAGLWSEFDYKFGYDLFAMARSNDFVGTEIWLGNPMDNYRFVYADRRYFNIFRHEGGYPVFGLVYHSNDEYFAYFGWAMNNMLGQSTWDSTEVSVKSNTPNFLKWPENMNKQFAREMGDVAIIFSEKSRNWAPSGVPARDGIGLSQILSDNHVQHVILTERSLKESEDLKKFRVVILPSTCCLSDEEIQVVREYVKQGGHVYVMGDAGLLDVYGTARAEWGFADIVGCDVSVNATWPVGTRLSSEGGQSIPYSQSLLKIIPRSNSTSLKVLVNTMNNQGRILGPACVSNTFGKGTITYCSAQLGTMNYQTVYRDTWEYELDPSLAEIFLKTFRETAGSEPLNFEVIQISPQMISSHWRQNIDGVDCTLIHFLNATGVRMKKGDKMVYKKTLPAFPALDKDVIFEIGLPSISQAYVTSPDYAGRKEVRFEKVDEGRYRVIVPKEAIHAYAMVVLQ